jgi:hypothetical protein
LKRKGERGEKILFFTAKVSLCGHFAIIHEAAAYLSDRLPQRVSSPFYLLAGSFREREREREREGGGMRRSKGPNAAPTPLKDSTRQTATRNFKERAAHVSDCLKICDDIRANRRP